MSYFKLHIRFHLPKVSHSDTTMETVVTVQSTVHHNFRQIHLHVLPLWPPASLCHVALCYFHFMTPQRPPKAEAGREFYHLIHFQELWRPLSILGLGRDCQLIPGQLSQSTSMLLCSAVLIDATNRRKLRLVQWGWLWNRYLVNIQTKTVWRVWRMH